MAEIKKDSFIVGRHLQVSVHPSEARPYSTRHFPDKYHRRLLRLSSYYGTSLEEMLNCSVGHGLSALERIRTQQEAEKISAQAEAEAEEAEAEAESEAE